MTRINLKKLQNPDENLCNVLEKLYGNVSKPLLDRFEGLILSHLAWSGEDYRLFSSPGRIEVIGNHTDHNNGKVVAAAVTVDNLAAVTETDTGVVTVKTAGYPNVVVGTDDLEYRDNETGTSEALVRGVLYAFKEKGYNIGGFDATTVNDVFKGAGMSSSASFEVLITEILNVLYNDGKIDAVERAKISQFAENKYFGKPSGLMDQTAVALGGISYIDFKDVSAPVIKNLDWSFKDASVVVINCGGDHCDLTENYKSIKTEMEEVAAYYGEKKLRFVDYARFMNDMGKLKEEFSGRAILRAMHFFKENQRVDEMLSALSCGDEKKFFDLVNESGKSSYQMLQNLYPEGITEQPVPLALAIAAEREGVLAKRVHGGGFAGTILVFVKNALRDTFIEYMGNIYGKNNVYNLGIRQYGTIEITE